MGQFAPHSVHQTPLIESMVHRLVKRFEPLQIILFGSWARGEAKADSDIDLLIVMPDETDKRQAAIAMRRHVSDFPVPKDLILTTPEELARRGELIGTILRVALREGRVLYERH